MLVGFSGVAGSGKTEAAKCLEPFGFAVVSLADPLKRICRDVFDFSESQLWGPSAARNAPDSRYPRWVADIDGEQVQQYLSPRFALQLLGTEWGRYCYEDIWVDYAIRVAKLLNSTPLQIFYDVQRGVIPAVEGSILQEHVAIPDVRFKNELVRLKEHGARIFRIVRPGAGLAGREGGHPSEQEQHSIPDDAFDGVLDNSGSLAQFHAIVRRAVLGTV